jgi:ankyrin repeat protein
MSANGSECEHLLAAFQTESRKRNAGEMLENKCTELGETRHCAGAPTVPEHERVVEALMDVFDVNLKDADGRTALHRAIKTQNQAACTALLKHKATDVNLKDARYGDTALHIAVHSENREAFDALLQHPAIEVGLKDAEGRTTLHLTVEQNNQGAFDALLKHPATDVNKKTDIDAYFEGYTALHIAAELGSIYHCKALLQHPNTDVNAKSHSTTTPLHTAIFNEKVDVCIAIIQHPGVDVNATNDDGETALHYVMGHRLMHKVVNKLLQHPDIDVNAKEPTYGRSALLDAFFYNWGTYAMDLLRHPQIDLELTDNDRISTLSYAAGNGCHTVCEFLLYKASGLQVNSPDVDGRTPFMSAVGCSVRTLDVSIAKTLAACRKVDVRSALDWIAPHGFTDIGYAAIFQGFDDATHADRMKRTAVASQLYAIVLKARPHSLWRKAQDYVASWSIATFWQRLAVERVYAEGGPGRSIDIAAAMADFGGNSEDNALT